MKGFLSRLAAMFLLSIPGSILLKASERRSLAQLESDPTLFLAKRKETMMHVSGSSGFLTILVLGIIFLVSIEIVAYLVRGDWLSSDDSDGN